MSVKAQSQTETCYQLNTERGLNMTAYNMFPNDFVQAFGKYSNKQATVISHFRVKHLFRRIPTRSRMFRRVMQSSA